MKAVPPHSSLQSLYSVAAGSTQPLQPISTLPPKQTPSQSSSEFQSGSVAPSSLQAPQSSTSAGPLGTPQQSAHDVLSPPQTPQSSTTALPPQTPAQSYYASTPTADTETIVHNSCIGSSGRRRSSITQSVHAALTEAVISTLCLTTTSITVRYSCRSVNPCYLRSKLRDPRRPSELPSGIIGGNLKHR